MSFIYCKDINKNRQEKILPFGLLLMSSDIFFGYSILLLLLRVDPTSPPFLNLFYFMFFLFIF